MWRLKTRTVVSMFAMLVNAACSGAASSGEAVTDARSSTAGSASTGNWTTGSPSAAARAPVARGGSQVVGVGSSATAACVDRYVECSFANPGDRSACSAQLQTCNLPSPENVAACVDAMVGCAADPRLDHAMCVAQAPACRTSDAIALWNTGADLATESSEFAVSVPIAFLTALGQALKPLGLKFVTDAVSNVLCVVPQIVRCSTFADYIRCIESNRGMPKSCAAKAAECGFSEADQVALAGAAECAAELSRCSGPVETCIAGSSMCEQFGPLDLASALGGITTKSTADILSAILPAVPLMQESELKGCKCAQDFGQCVDQSIPEDVEACAMRAKSCSPDTPPPPPPAQGGPE